MKCTSEDCTDESMEDMIYCEYHGKLHGQEEVSLVTTRLNRNLDSLNALYNILFSLGIAGITFLVLMLVNGINHDGKFLVTQLGLTLFFIFIILSFFLYLINSYKKLFKDIINRYNVHNEIYRRLRRRENDKRR